MHPGSLVRFAGLLCDPVVIHANSPVPGGKHSPVRKDLGAVISIIDWLEHGTNAARQALGYPADTPFPAEGVATAYKFALVAGLSEACGGSRARAELAHDAVDLLTRLMQCARAAGHPLETVSQPGELPRRRIVDLALDALGSEPLCPEMLLPTQPRALSAAPVFALIFTAFPYCGHELYPLLVDACVADFPGQVIGVHAGWLRQGAACRAISFDARRGVLVEADCPAPVPLAGAQVLALRLTAEAEDHRRITRLLGAVPVANPYVGARTLDAKAETAAIWRQHGLPTPAVYYCPRHAPVSCLPEALAALGMAAGVPLVIKPADGTEGRGVAFFTGEPAEADRRRGHLAALLEAGPALVMAERGSLRVHGDLRCVVRLNVCCDGRHAWAESGYAQVAGSPDGVASAGRGGRIVPLDTLWRQLYRADGTPVVPSAHDWRHLLATAEAGALALANALGGAMPVLVGIDLLLDAAPDGGIAPVLLEANPRPAGMSHSRYVTPTGPTDEPGVTQRLWTLLPVCER